MNEERTKNDVGIDQGCDSEAPRPHFFFFFLLLLLNFTKSVNVWKSEPITSAPSRLSIEKRGGGWIAARPGNMVTSLLSFLGAQASQRLAWVSHGSEKASKWPFCPPFWVFSVIFSEMSKNLSDCVATRIKQLNLVIKNQNVSKWSSLDEIRVWQK